MTRTIVTLAAAGAIGLAGMTAAPRQADAAAWWVAPAIVFGTIGAVTLGAAAAQANSGYYDRGYAYGPGGTVYVRPTYAPQSCTVMRERMPDGRLRRVRVCD